MRTMKAMLAAGAAAMLMAGAAEAREIKIGFIITKSGGAAQFGDQIEKGARLYMKQNAKQIAPHTIRLIIRDSKRPGGPIAKAAAQELIAREKVEMITGLVFSPNAMALPMASRRLHSKSPLVSESLVVSTTIGGFAAAGAMVKTGVAKAISAAPATTVIPLNIVPLPVFIDPSSLFVRTKPVLIRTAVAAAPIGYRSL